MYYESVLKNNISFLAITGAMLRVLSQVMTTLPAFLFMICCSVLSAYYQQLYLLITAPLVTEHQIDQLSHQLLTVFTGLRDVTEFLRHRFSFILLINVTHLYVNLIIKIYWVVSQFLPKDTGYLVVYVWVSQGVIENLIRMIIICTAVDNINDSV